MIEIVNFWRASTLWFLYFGFRVRCALTWGEIGSSPGFKHTGLLLPYYFIIRRGRGYWYPCFGIRMMPRISSQGILIHYNQACLNQHHNILIPADLQNNVLNLKNPGGKSYPPTCDYTLTPLHLSRKNVEISNIHHPPNPTRKGWMVNLLPSFPFTYQAQEK